MEPAQIAARLRLSTTRLARQLRREAGAGRTPSQLSALATIDHHGPLTLGELADRESIAPPSITKVVAKLEEDGLVTRTSDAVDRRVARVALTPAGHALVEESRERKTAWLAARVDELTPIEQRKIAAALDVLDALAGRERT